MASPQKRRRTDLLLGILLLAALLGAVLFFLARGTYHDYRLASAAVDRFHQHLNAGQYDEICAKATADFRSSATQAELLKFFEMIHEKMGNSGKMSFAGFHVNWKNGRVWVDQVLNTQFELRQGTESLIWVRDGDQLQLYHYRINSPNLQ